MTISAAGAKEAGAPTLSIILVHGAFVDASGWQQVHGDLVGRGYEVFVTQHPTISLEGDVAATKRLIAAARHPTLLVGHSYGGAVITEAGADAKVKGLAYIAAFVPDVGESVAELNEAAGEPGEAKAPVLATGDGNLIVEPARFGEAFAADVDAATTGFMAAMRRGRPSRAFISSHRPTRWCRRARSGAWANALVPRCPRSKAAMP